MAYSVAGRSVLITGAARGIGAETARELSSRGARLALVGLEPELLAEVAAECGPDAVWFEADVTDAGSLNAAVQGALDAFGGLDVCIANAGISGGGLVRLAQYEAIERTIEINLLGAIRTLQTALPHVVERKGYLLAVASLAATVHSPGMAAYASSKAGIEAFADCLRTELRHHGAGVGVAYFSFIDTDMVRGADERRGYRFLKRKLRGPLGRALPVSAAAGAVADGIERRARWVVVPRFATWLVVGRALAQLIGDRQAAREMPEFERIAQEELDEIGVERASEPVGPGGRAAARARVGR